MIARYSRQPNTLTGPSNVLLTSNGDVLEGRELFLTRAPPPLSLHVLVRVEKQKLGSQGLQCLLTTKEEGEQCLFIVSQRNKTDAIPSLGLSDPLVKADFLAGGDEDNDDERK